MSTPDAAGNLVASGTITVTDGDAGDTQQFTAQTKTGTYGDLEVDADGTWTYKVANSDPEIQDLKDGETLTDTFMVTSADAVSTTTITIGDEIETEFITSLTITIRGADDLPVLAGVNDDPEVETATGSVTEDTAVDANGDLVETGSITSTGGDKGEGGFEAETISDTGTHYGSLTIETGGAWTYTAANSLPAIDDLGKGETLTDTFTVTSADGVTTIPVTITIIGKNDAPEALDDAGDTTENTELTLAAADTGTGLGGGAQNAGLLLNDTDAEGDSLTITLVGTTEDNQDAANIGKAIDGSHGGTFTINADGAWEFDPDGNPANNFNGLKVGEMRTTSVTYTVSDGSKDRHRHRHPDRDRDRRQRCAGCGGPIAASPLKTPN